MSQPPAPAPLRHRVDEEPGLNRFLRDGELMLHLHASMAPARRLVMAFAAGNSGAGLWFEPADDGLQWQIERDPERLPDAQHDKGPLRGAGCTLRANVDALRLRQGLIGSVRMLRDHQHDGRLFAPCVVAPTLSAHEALWDRPRLDGAAGYRMRLALLDGARIDATPDGRLQLQAARPGAGLRLRFEAWTGDTPLQGLAEHALLNEHAKPDAATRRALSLLCHEDAWLAGSWRYLTYFGRDTLMSLALLLPVLGRPAVHGALRSVLLRLSPEGRVAHEEDVGEFPGQQRLAAGGAPDCTPVYDYKMSDDDFMLLPVAAEALLDAPDAAAFLASRIGAETAGSRLLRNIRWVLARTAAFMADPRPANLVGLAEGEIVGDWRDSGDGLAGGRYAYSTNAALVPAALRAVQRLQAAGLLAPHLQSGDAALLASAEAAATVWAREAPRCFDIALPLAAYREAVARQQPAAARAKALASLDGPQGETLAFGALSLDAAGRPLPVLHSDFGFVLLFGEPEPERLARELAAIARPYPAGLMTEAGLLVANATPADPALWPLFGRDRYHGAVVWSWQQALMAAGLARQLRRSDLEPPLRAQIGALQQQLWAAIEANREAAGGELWSWSHDGQRFRMSAYGPLSAVADESNAIQLWSTVYLAVRAPA